MRTATDRSRVKHIIFTYLTVILPPLSLVFFSGRLTYFVVDLLFISFGWIPAVAYAISRYICFPIAAAAIPDRSSVHSAPNASDPLDSDPSDPLPAPPGAWT